MTHELYFSSDLENYAWFYAYLTSRFVSEVFKCCCVRIVEPFDQKKWRFVCWFVCLFVVHCYRRELGFGGDP